MPCYDGGPSETFEQIRFRLDKLTELLCYTCQNLPEKEINAIRPLASWWRKHQRQDSKRKEKELADLQWQIEESKRALIEASERVNTLTHQLHSLQPRKSKK